MNSNNRLAHWRTTLLAVTMIVISVLIFSACSSPTPEESPSQADEVNPLFSETSPEETQAPESDDQEAGDEIPAVDESPELDLNGIVIDLNAETQPINPALLGTNVPAWLNKQRTTDEIFIERTMASGTSMLRIPGGSWANYYEWLPCELENKCPWDWGVLTPTDFINLINDTGLEAMYTVNMNGTAKEAAALVAFFNGAVDDDTTIGVDVLGRDWGTVSEWAQLRTDHGNPDPVGITYWEVGNEIFAGKQDMGTDCNQSWGWEDVWTCDGTEYVTGIGEGEERKEGFLEYVEAMKAVDSSILVGAVGVYPQDEWNNWGYEVIANAGDVMDFYIIHEYAFFDPPRNNESILTTPQSIWGTMKGNIQDAFNRFSNGRSVPIAVTEYNLFSAQDADEEQLMTRAVNMLFLADTIGQMATHGFPIANQWNLANGQAENGTDYGLLHADSFVPYPQYYVFPMWSRFGSEILPVTSPYASNTTLSVYAGKQEEGTISLLAINKTGESISSEIHILNASNPFTSGSVDVIQADSLDSETVTFNGISEPAGDLSDAPSFILEPIENPTTYTFEPYSITLIRFVP